MIIYGGKAAKYQLVLPTVLYSYSCHNVNGKTTVKEYVAILKRVRKSPSNFIPIGSFLL